ncbi:hypothetical protein BDZ85DRAFT_263289 [Elsinoe ampelina]|uniref:Uncharacterized protein n=1 Tax=Elsinoe ampelina TaxID=302913 RepID=A0A6A6G8Y1_9PEZI|nr:hypothetical protein BDZ85DRAFT_263289 [Elsinoe ampelina]
MTPSSTLCSICQAQPHKYRCPTHPSILTCSLPCYKRHQSRASCNGKRNASTYVKKSHLSTPAGFDHDYNFLTKIERGIKVPKDMVEDMERPAKKRRMGGHPGLDTYFANNQIGVEEAPPGFQRGKQNETRWLKRSKKVLWTVEWVDMNGKKVLGKAIEDETLGIAHAKILGDIKGGKADLSDQHGDVKEKLQSTEEVHEVAFPEDAAQSAVKSGQESPLALKTSQDSECTRADVTLISHLDPAANQRHFYLQLPRCLTSKTVLIPLEASSSITKCLRGRNILEFPTIYALPFDSTNLPEPYTTEAEYKKSLAKEYNEVDVAQIVRSVNATVGKKGALASGIFAAQDEKEEALDKERILEMLRRDLQG